jgi:hypothetical protein
MARAINLGELRYPDEATKAQISRGDWPELSVYQWAILVGHPAPFMPWDATTITREECGLLRRRQEHGEP